MIYKRYLFLLLLPFLSCYTFKSTGIPVYMETFWVAEFDNNTNNVVPTLSYDFTQALINKINNESRLQFTENNPDVEFSGTITRFSVTSVAPEERNGVPTAAFNRLDIAVQVNYKNNREEETNPANQEWTQTFSFYLDFDNNQNLLDVQDELIEDINEQIVEDIFNRAFSGW